MEDIIRRLLAAACVGLVGGAAVQFVQTGNPQVTRALQVALGALTLLGMLRVANLL